MSYHPVIRRLYRRTCLAAAGAAVVHLGVVAAMAQDSADSLSKKRSIAASQHEIVLLLIGKKQYAEAVTEADRIFDLKWPADQEPVLLKELLSITGKLAREKQPAHGMRLLERNGTIFRSRDSKIAILKEKGFLYKEMGESDKAIEAFKEASALEASSPKED